MSELRLQSPVWLLALIPVLLLVWYRERRRRSFPLVYSSVAGLSALPVTLAHRIKKLLPLLRVAALTCLVVALARPQRGLSEFRVRTEGISIMMCLDRSGSMEAMDFEVDGSRVTRLDVVKRTFHDFVAGEGTLKGRPDDLVGLIVFGGFAESRCPLTLDHGTLLNILGDVEIPAIVRDEYGQVVDKKFQEAERATAIGDAIARGIDRLKNVESKSKVLVLLSDGENTAGVVEPLAAAEAAKSLGVKVYCIGVGSTGMAPFPVRDRYGKVVLESRGVALDEQLLTKIADTTGGRYFNVRDTDTLTDVYATIDELEKTETESLLYTEYREMFPFALIPGAVLLVAELLLRATRFSSIP